MFGALSLALILCAISWSDGVFRIRFRHCDSCRATVTLKIGLPFAIRNL
jgi:hypothetical protein